MSLPKPPPPMTPDRAGQFAARLRWAALAALVVAILIGLAGDSWWGLVPLAIGVLCLLEAAACRGWRAGWLAKERADLKVKLDGGGR